MARSIRIPLVVDVVRVEDPAEIRTLNADERLDRRFGRMGPLVNRVVEGRILNCMRTGNRLLPAFLSRGDEERELRRRALEDILSAAADDASWDDATLAPLVAFVRGEVDRETAGIAVQRLVGRLFHDDYDATPETYAAARLVDKYPRSKPLRALWWRISGRLRKARQLAWKAARDDGHAVHATVIAMHNIVRSLSRMRRIKADPGRAGRVTDENIVRMCIAAPPTLVRKATAGITTPEVPRRLREGALVLFSLERAQKRSADVGDAFMTGTWAQCPAHAFVPALLREVWRRAQEGSGTP